VERRQAPVHLRADPPRAAAQGRRLHGRRGALARGHRGRARLDPGRARRVGALALLKVR
jgi:hypothetical protein